ncbi:sulfurtransferase [Paenibacillus tengchongensis]|uniref:sulfurtransferase n=1 Tax=Paenibacillus tengchongensis TaxID=2608684 RepID=UPI00124DD6B4|nr:rhodanese-like domain-containing protein [Paenibacillus tengchongensis]
MDKKAGHIPGALNYIWKDTQDAEGSYKSAEQLAEHFAGLDKNCGIITYCGSGVTVCLNVWRRRRSNVDVCRGWSDWSSYGDNPI